MRHLIWSRQFAALLVGTLTMLILIACAGAQPAAPQQEAATPQPEITVLYLGEPPFWLEQAERFEEATGIQVNYEEVPFPQLRDKVFTTFAAGAAEYDVVHVRDDWAAEFGSQGFLTPLDDFIEQEGADWKSQYAEGSFENLSYDGSTYGVPRYFWLWQFYYNKELLEQADVSEPPETWEEVIEVGKKVTTSDVHGYLEPWGGTMSVNAFLVHLHTEGGTFIDDNNQAAFHSPAGQRALQTMVDLYQTHKIVPEVAFELTGTGPAADLFVQGNIAMGPNTPHTFPMANDPERSNVVGKVGVGLIPAGQAGSASFAETGGLAIPATSKNKASAWEYIKFVTGFDEEKRMAMEAGRIPANVAALNDPDVQDKYPHFALVDDQLQHPYGMWMNFPEASEVQDALSRELVRALRENQSVEEALAAGEEIVNEILSGE